MTDQANDKHGKATHSDPAEDRWVAFSALALSWSRFRREWVGLGETRRRWGRRFGAWTLVSLLTTVVVVVAGRALLPAPERSWEQRALLSIEANDLVSFNSALWLEGPANGFVMWGVVWVAALVAAWRRRPLIAASFLLGFGVLYFNIFLGWGLWPRTRPALIAEGVASPGALGSYPSGHVAQAVFVYGLLSYLWLRASASRAERVAGVAALVVLIAIIGFARLRLGSHWPSDLAAGFVISAVWTFGVIDSLRAAGR